MLKFAVFRLLENSPSDFYHYPRDKTKLQITIPEEAFFQKSVSRLNRMGRQRKL